MSTRTATYTQSGQKTLGLTGGGVVRKQAAQKSFPLRKHQRTAEETAPGYTLVIHASPAVRSDLLDLDYNLCMAIKKPAEALARDQDSNVLAGQEATQTEPVFETTFNPMPLKNCKKLTENGELPELEYKWTPTKQFMLSVIPKQYDDPDVEIDADDTAAPAEEAPPTREKVSVGQAYQVDFDGGITVAPDDVADPVTPSADEIGFYNLSSARLILYHVVQDVVTGTIFDTGDKANLVPGSGTINVKSFSLSTHHPMVKLWFSYKAVQNSIEVNHRSAASLPLRLNVGENHFYYLSTGEWGAKDEYDAEVDEFDKAAARAKLAKDAAAAAAAGGKADNDH